MENHRIERTSNTPLKHLLVVLFALLPAVYVATQWSAIPHIIPTHFNAAMEADAYGSKFSVWVFIGLMTSVNLLVYLLVTNLHKIDPKRVHHNKSATYSKLTVGIVVFITMVQFGIVLKAIHPDIKMLDRVTYPLAGLLFVFMGNYLYNIKPNYFVGIRFPWTLASDYNWRKTHRLGGRLFFITGLVIIPVTLFAPVVIATTFFVTVTLLTVIVLLIYSYNIFRTESRNAGYYDREQSK